VADFGFSKSAEETFGSGADTMWRWRHGEGDSDVPSGCAGGPVFGYGAGWAWASSGFEHLDPGGIPAAADPKRFSRADRSGLEPWQAKKLYIGNVCGFGAMTCADANWNGEVKYREASADLGGSYVQFAMQGLRHQLSQGSANWTADPGDRFTFYKLVDSVVPPKLDKDGHEKDFFDGIDTSLPGLAARSGAEESKVPQLRGELTEIEKKLPRPAWMRKRRIR